MKCARCGEAAARGVLCGACLQGLAVVNGLLPGHIASRAPAGGKAWLVDGFGVPHPLAERTVVGRRPECDLGIHNGSVSRDHAELRATADGWQVRDLGSRNGTFLDATRIAGRASLAPGAAVKFGDVAFYLALAIDGHAPSPAISLETGTPATAAVRYRLAGDALELLLIGRADAGDDAGGGVLLHRASGAPTWSELALPRLEHQLLQLLAAQAIVDAGPAATRGTVATKLLARKLPFQSRYANEENVRQVVRRLRDSLDGVGAGDLLGNAPGRGYFVAWPVSLA